MMSGGRGILTLTSTLAIVGIGNTSINAKNIVPNKNLFILWPPLSIPDLISGNRRCNDAPLVFLRSFFIPLIHVMTSIHGYSINMILLAKGLPAA